MECLGGHKVHLKSLLFISMKCVLSQVVLNAMNKPFFVVMFNVVRVKKNGNFSSEFVIAFQQET